MAGLLDYIGNNGGALGAYLKSLDDMSKPFVPSGMMPQGGPAIIDLPSLLGRIDRYTGGKMGLGPVAGSPPQAQSPMAGDTFDQRFGGMQPPAQQPQAPAPMQMQPPQMAQQAFNAPDNAFQWGNQTFPMYGGPQMAQADPAAIPPNAQPTTGRGTQVNQPLSPQEQPDFQSELFARAPKKSALDNFIDAFDSPAARDAKIAQRENTQAVYGHLLGQGMSKNQAAQVAVLAARNPEVLKEIMKPYANLDAASSSQYQGRGSSNDALNRKVQQTSVLKAAEHAAVNGGVNLTPGQKALDDKFAPEAQEWLSGGFTDVQKSIQNLQGAVAALRSGRTLTGPFTGATPDAVRSFTNPESIANRDRVGEVVQRNLKTILGSQFTQQEGNALIARAYNERLGEAENARRIENLMNQMQGAAQAKQEMTDYFTKNGTLQGYTGKIPRIGDFDPESDRNPYAPKSKNVSSGNYVFDGKDLRKMGR